jgi:hypothetical protein
MTSEDWDRCVNPQEMLALLHAVRMPDERKCRLFCCACCRRLEGVLRRFSKATEALAVAERYAAGEADREELCRALGLAREVKKLAWTLSLGQAARGLVWALSGAVGVGDAAQAARELASAASNAASEPGRYDIDRSSIALRAEEEAQCALARDIFGSPFRPPLTVDPAVLAWHDGAARRLARGIYAARRFQDLPILADLLEEAGATDAELLGHLRGPGPHVLGCHALDAVLGKS